jgi:hypothetical protein
MVGLGAMMGLSRPLADLQGERERIKGVWAPTPNLGAEVEERDNGSSGNEWLGSDLHSKFTMVYRGHCCSDGRL